MSHVASDDMREHIVSCISDLEVYLCKNIVVKQALTVVHTSNMGFNLLVTALLFLGYPVLGYYTIHTYKSPIAVGTVLGTGVV